MNYGYVDKKCLHKQAELICNVLGNGKNNTANKYKCRKSNSQNRTLVFKARQHG